MVMRDEVALDYDAPYIGCFLEAGRKTTRTFNQKGTDSFTQRSKHYLTTE